MLLFVLAQMSDPATPMIAMFALIGFLSGMHSLVLYPILARMEARVAKVTLVRFDRSVLFNMRIESLWGFERSITDMTFV